MLKLIRFLLPALLPFFAVAQQLPASYPGQARLLSFQGGYHTQLIDSLDRLARHEGKEAFRQLLRAQGYFYRSTFQPNERKNEEGLLECLAGFARSRNRPMHLHTLVLLSQFYWNRQDPAHAFEYGLRAYEGYQDLDGGQFPPKHFALYELGSKCYSFRDFSSAARYLREALSTQRAIETVGRNNILNTLGLCYRNLEQYDSAEWCFRQALELSPFERNPAWNAIIAGNLGITYYLQHRYGEAVPLLERDIRKSVDGRAALDNGVKTMAILGDIYLQRGQTAEAARLLEQAYRISCEEGFLGNYQLMSELYPRIAQLEERRGNGSRASFFWKAALGAADTLTRERNLLVLTGAQLKVNAEKQMNALSILQQKARFQRLTRNSLITAIVLLAVIAILFIQKQQARHAFAQRQASVDLAEAGRQLEVFMQVAHEKSELLERFRLEWSQSHPDSSPLVEDPEVLTELRALTILTEEEWSRFQILFEKVHAGFFERLQAKLPGLTPADTRYMALGKLGLSNKEIGSMLGISAASVRVTRSRLRKKLALSEEGDLEAVLATI